MGFSISWVAVQGIEKAVLLDLLGFGDSREDDAANETPFSAADIGTGWSLIWSNDLDWAARLSPQRFHDARPVIAVQLHEGIMYAEAWCVAGGKECWRVVHDADQGPDHLDVTGNPPELDEVRREIRSAQSEDSSGEVDYFFDIPVAVAARIIGFRHDHWEYDGKPRPDFTSVTPIGDSSVR